jgi:hypothetical protein
LGHVVKLTAFGQSDLDAALGLQPKPDEAQDEQSQIEEDQFEKGALSVVDVRHRAGIIAALPENRLVSLEFVHAGGGRAMG